MKLKHTIMAGLTAFTALFLATFAHAELIRGTVMSAGSPYYGEMVVRDTATGAMLTQSQLASQGIDIFNASEVASQMATIDVGDPVLPTAVDVGDPVLPTAVDVAGGGTVFANSGPVDVGDPVLPTAVDVGDPVLPTAVDVLP